MRRRFIRSIVLGFAAIFVGVSLYGIRLVQGGLSVRDKPSLIETFIARKSRRWAIPAKARSLKNPMLSTLETLVQGRNHWADHCATCHANNGSGETEIGRNLYPKTPDMRQRETQSLSDGELYYIIRNGVRMTGMPAWGEPNLGSSDAATWTLVSFIRHLPNVTPGEEAAMEKLNPKGVMEREEEQREEDFLNGKTPMEEKHEH